MKKAKKLIMTCLFLGMGTSLAYGQVSVIPKPQSIQERDGKLMMNQNQPISIQCHDKKLREESKQMVLLLKEELDLNATLTTNKHKDARITIERASQLGKEAYTLDITPTHIRITTNGTAGLAYATNTLIQIMRLNNSNQEFSLPLVSINDAPRFAYRGVHIDVARHFFPFDSLLRLVDMAALHKLNRIHLHLTDNQGWRMEIKRYPNLTNIGAWRDSTIIGRNGPMYKQERHGGFYTQAQLREFVAYAQKKHIEVLPEIDMPGHTLAALAAYPELGCKGNGYAVSGKWGISDEALCPGNEPTYTFVENILDEVMAIFPYDYIHIGGDECLKGDWEKCPRCQTKIKTLGLVRNASGSPEEQLQSYFTQRIERYLNAKGRKLVGWDEILEGGLSAGATVMSWRNTGYGYKAARMGNNVILTPSEYCYFNFYQTPDINGEPEALDGCVSLEKTYSFEPIPQDQMEIADKIMGIQACLWSEHVHNFKTAEYMLLPRLAAIAEVAWSNPEKSYNEFTERLINLFPLYKKKGYAFSRELFVVTPHLIRDYMHGQQTIDFSAIKGSEIRYTTNGENPTLESPRYTNPIPITGNTTVKATAFFKGEPSKTRTQAFVFSSSTLCPTTLAYAPTPAYAFDGAETLCDGLTGDMNYKSGRWLGFSGKPLIATVDLKHETTISNVSFNALVSVWDWIFRPESCRVEGSTDNREFIPLGELHPEATPKESYCIETFSIPIPQSQIRYLRITLTPVEQMPVWHPGKGKPAFIFIDEITVH